MSTVTDLVPGDVVRHRRGDTHVLARRKEDDSGWWLADGGGLADYVLAEDGEWTVVSSEAERLRALLQVVLPVAKYAHVTAQYRPAWKYVIAACERALSSETTT